MSPFANLSEKIHSWKSSPNKDLLLNNVSWEQWLLVQSASNICEDGWGNTIYICPEISLAEKVYAKQKNLKPDLYFYPGLELSPYDGSWSIESNAVSRFVVLSKLAKGENLSVVMSSEASSLKVPPKEFFLENSLSLKISDVWDHDELLEKLIVLGYSPSISVEEPGSFAKKGEILDIYPVGGQPIRIHFFDELIEEIFLIDKSNNRTLREKPIEEAELSVHPRALLSTKYNHALRANISIPPPNMKAKFSRRKEVFDSLKEGREFHEFYSLTPLFFDESVSIFDYLSPNENKVLKIESREIEDQAIELKENLREEFEAVDNDTMSDNIVPDPSNIYNFSNTDITRNFKSICTNHLDLSMNLDQSDRGNEQFQLNLSFIGLRNLFPELFKLQSNKIEFIEKLFLEIQEKFKSSGHIFILYKTESSLAEIKYLLEGRKLSGDLNRRIEFIKENLEDSFYYKTEEILFLSDSDLFSKKLDKNKSKSRKNTDVFADTLASLSKGDFVIHHDHGVGKFNGLVNLDLSGRNNDFVEIEYADGDKVYLPTYKLDLIQKYAESSASTKIASLKTTRFEKAKQKARSAAKALAFDLIKLNAERSSLKAYQFELDEHAFKEFELAFPYRETPDQLKAIEDVIEDMTSSKPMDRLVCGDVGFGKTEIAMRAAFLAASNSKQTAVLVPTTVLAFQHYNSFLKRYKGFPVNIEFISRFRSASDIKKITEKLKSGEIDIIIGTHSILSKMDFFKDLGLVIVDEEQRFGVGHKEKLKLLKSTVDFLTLTATPIPRTLQLSFLGLRDLSVIKTAPPKRQSIKSYIVRHSKQIINKAIDREIQRGGQVFFVHNRVDNIELVANEIRESHPKAKILIAHGQLPERDLEKRMKDFYEGAYNVLISTTIIESGIDIPTANTMIINKANTFGLSQLHQLRGRIGRSERKAYAYFLIPTNKKLTPVAEKRLQSLQLYSEIGSGFNIASSDLEIRGAGDILGPVQSGHIENIGLELYMQLLKEAIAEIKGESKTVQRDVEMVLPADFFIPNKYVNQTQERLRLYKKLSNAEFEDEIESIAEDISDQFGPMPSEVKNLILVFKAKIYLRSIAVKHFKASNKKCTLTFNKEILEQNEELRNSIIKVFTARPKVYQITPNFSVIYSSKDPLSFEAIAAFSKDIAQQIVP